MRYGKLVCTVALACAPAFCLAQEVAFHSTTDVVGRAPDTSASPTASSSVVASNQTGSTKSSLQSKLDRWIDLDTLSTSLRYRNTANTNGTHMFDFGQHRELLDGRLKLDNQGKYTVNFHASSGRYFNWAYADTIGGQFSDTVPTAVAGLSLPDLIALGMAIQNDPQGLTYAKGIASRGGYFYVRQLYIRASPIKQLTMEFGSLPIEHGVNTEITSFDDDGYIAGERLRFDDPKRFYFDEVSATSAYLGDALVPNFFARGARFGQSNYQQYLFRKTLSKNIVASTDYTHLRHTRTIREAVALQLPSGTGVDSVRAEFYQRLNDVTLFGANAPAASGFAVSVTKAFKTGLNGEAGYASIDNSYAVYSGSSFLLAIKFAWNSDSFMNGKHPYAKLNWKVAPGLTLNGFYTHIIDTNSYGVSGQTLEAGFTYNIADLLHRKNVL